MAAIADQAFPRVSGPSTAQRYLRGFLRFMRNKPLGAFGLVIIVALLIVALLPDLFAPQAYDDIDILNSLKGPHSGHWFGTDSQGRDVLSRVIYGAETSVIIGFGAVAIGSSLATVIGLISGYYGGKVDLFMQRVVEIWQAFPGVIFIIFLVSIFGPGRETVIVSVGILFGAGQSRIIRSTVISVKSNVFVEAARSTGATDLRLMVRHILPNVVPFILIGASIQIGAAILIESSLSFLGFGVPPPFPSWGRMLQDAQSDMQYHPYLAIFPGAAIAVTIYSFNMFGDALRDVLDPRLRGSR